MTPFTKYVTLSDEEKLRLLNEHSFEPWASLDQTLWCLHCEKEFCGRDVRVWEDAAGEHWLECGTPDCNGSPIDWAPYPWWDDQHPLTKANHPEGEEAEEDVEDWGEETPPTVQ